MDPFVLIFYAVICGGLGLVAPNLGSPAIRLGVGAGIGIAAAALLPIIRGILGL